MATSVNYTGRTIDYLIFQGVAATGQQQVSLELGDETGGQVCTGVQKVSQTFTSMLLTKVGTLLADSEYGTEFMTKAQSGMFRTDADVKTAFSGAAELVRRKMRQEAAANNLPNDERLARVELTSISLDRGASKLTLAAQLITDAGSTRTVYLPVSVVIR